MPLYRCRYLDSISNVFQIHGVACENDAEAIAMARRMSANTSADGFELIKFAADSLLEGGGFELVWGFFCQVVVFGFCRFFVRSGKAVLRPVAYDQVRGARGRGQGTETVAKLGGLPPSGACVSQRLDA